MTPRTFIYHTNDWSLDKTWTRTDGLVGEVGL